MAAGGQLSGSTDRSIPDSHKTPAFIPKVEIDLNESQASLSGLGCNPSEIEDRLQQRNFPREN